MDEIPPDIQIPDRFPPLPYNLRWSKRFERAAVEVNNLFNRGARKQALAKFQEKWAFQERQSAAVGLAIRKLFHEYGHTRTIQIATLQRLPSDMVSRSEIYQQHEFYEKLVNAYRARLGLPPRDPPLGPSPG